MAFKRNDIRRISNVLSCSQDDVKSSLYAGNSYLKKNQVNTYTVARCISIILDKLQKSTKNKNVIEYPDFDMKHIGIKRYRSDIVALYYESVGTEKGWGWIAKRLQEIHKIDITRQTVRTYIQRYEEWKLWQI